MHSIPLLLAASVSLHLGANLSHIDNGQVMAKQPEFLLYYWLNTVQVWQIWLICCFPHCRIYRVLCSLSQWVIFLYIYHWWWNNEWVIISVNVKWRCEHGVYDFCHSWGLEHGGGGNGNLEGVCSLHHAIIWSYYFFEKYEQKQQ